jgi:hypothetical protein
VVRDGELGGLGGVLEQHKEAIGAIDLAAAMAGEQGAGIPVVGGEDFCGPRITQSLDEPRAVHEVGQQESTRGHSNSWRGRAATPTRMPSWERKD